jgi:hypothetical protein
MGGGREIGITGAVSDLERRVRMKGPTMAPLMTRPPANLQ